MFYRVKLPLEQLELHGHEVTWRSAGDEAGNTPVTQREMEGHDIVLGQRYNHHAGLQVWRRARGPFSRLVYEIDDDVFNVGPENWQAYHLYGRGDIRDAVTHAAQVADLVTVTTEHLASVMRERTGNSSVAVLPNYIPAWVCDSERQPGPRRQIGWMGGASHGNDVGLIAAPVRRFIARFAGWDLKLIGTDFRPTFRVAKDRAHFAPWIPVVKDPEGYFGGIDFGIGLAPLMGTEFDQSKSAIKALEYAARGIPVIASDVGPYRDFVRHGETGFLVRYEHEWLKYMSELATDQKLRETMGAAARQLARQHTIEGHYAEWESAYDGLFPVKH
jgi:glycosyltransferase involved in cell wall biosynthesis